MGLKIKKLSNGSYQFSCQNLKSINKISTKEFPGYPTDLQAQVIATLLKTGQRSKVVENIFENRFMHVQELERMGASIRVKDNTASISGMEKRLAAPGMATDLRASASLILAGLAAEGTTEIARVYHIDRGYDCIEEKLQLIGARISRKPM